RSAGTVQLTAAAPARNARRVRGTAMLVPFAEAAVRVVTLGDVSPWSHRKALCYDSKPTLRCRPVRH
ncbi:MAG: hypothetical protein MI725_07355, partial [Pirellulales bacterium]|nr:hypothetical protein [Pirellulales bacterium]